MATARAGWKWFVGICLATATVAAAGCNDGRDLNSAPRSAAPAAAPSGDRLFFDDFEAAQLPQWEPNDGEWDLRNRRGGDQEDGREYGIRRANYALTVAGSPNWRDYSVEALVTIHDDRQGPAGVAGRLQSDHFYYELVLGRGSGGKGSWYLRQRLRHSWTTLASGPYDHELGVPQVLRLAFRGRRLQGSVSRDGGRSFVSLGAAEATGPSMDSGRIGLVSYGGDASFDDVLVRRDPSGAGNIVASEAQPYGPIVLLRDDTNVFPTGKPAGGWYVAPIHVTLRPHDGKVIVSGYGRAGEDNCETDGPNENSSRNGTSWVLNPAALDLDPGTLLVQPINEQGQDPVSDVIYCAGHNMISGGRVFFSGGSRHPGGFPFSNERGLNYGRIFNFDTNSFTRISVAMKGGTTQLPGEKWYPTNRLMPDGQVLIFGGFTFNSGGTGDRKNRSLELFDPAAWDLNPAGDPWTVLTQHAESPFGDETTPTRGYTNLLLLPKPLPANNGGGLARSVALMAGLGKVFLFNHEPGPTGAQRQLAKPNAMIPNGSPTEKGEGSSGVQLPDGRLMFVNGGHLGSDAAKAYFYTPSTDSWTSVALGVSRIYGDALLLPDGRVMIINGYVSEPGNIGDVTSPIGDPRQPEIIDPYTVPPTVTTLPGWTDQPWRGYHSVSLVLKDGRILLGAGKDTGHATGCEKHDMRIFEPPYLFGGGARPVINVAEGTSMTVGGGALTVPYTGTVRTTRGVALMAPGSLTHGFDMGQRYVPLDFTDNGDGTLTVQPPENVNIAPPGDYLLYIVSTTGVPSVGKHIALATPPPCRYAVDGNSPSYLEAEGRSRQSGPFTTVADAARSGGASIAVTEAGVNHSAEPDEGKVLWYDVNVASGGPFYLWALANGPDSSSDSFWLSADGLADVQLDLPAASWGWVRTTTASLNLATGKHTLKIKVREDGALLDKIVLTKDGAFTPTSLGGAALACNGLFAPTGLMATPGNASVNLTWNPVVGATSYTVKRSTTSGSGYMTVQSGISGTSFNNNTGLTNGTQYFFVVSAVNGAGESPNSGQVSATPVAAPTWTSQDVGAVATAGSWMLNTMTGVHTIAGNGADIWNMVDEFRFTYQQLTGNGSITARVVTFNNAGNNANAKAGVMIRQNLNANSPHVLACMPPQGTATLIKVIKRTTVGGASTSTSGASPNFPRWVRVVRSGTTLTAYESSNGTTFTQLGTPTTISTLGATAFVGLAVTSHTDGTSNTATFDNVTVTGSMPLPGAPTGLMCTAGNGQCALSWTAVSGATSYNVKRSTTSGSGYTTIANVPSPSHLDTTVNNSTQYFYVVSAVNGVGEGPNSAQASCLPVAPQPPGPPTNLACTAGNGQCACSWTAPISGATSYNLKRSLTSGSGYSPVVSNHPTTSFTDTTPANGLQHFYVVAANNAVGEGANSTQVSCTPIAPPSAPINLMATGGAGQATLNWTDTASNETGFKIERKPLGSPDTSFAQVGTAGANVQTFLNSPVAAGDYTYRVRATNSSGDSPFSNSADATVTTPPSPPAPSNLVATVTGGNTANLTWSDNSSNETGFRVERKVGAGSYSTLATKTANTISHADTPLATGTYTYRVIATGSPDSAPSNEAVVIVANPVADAYVRAGTAAGMNFGTAAVLDVKHTNTVATKRNAFLRFSLAGVAANVTSARLRLYGNAATSAKAAAVHSVADITWGETSITWNTPSVDAGGPAMSASPLATQTVAIAPAFVEWDVTAYIQQQKTAGASAVSLGVKSAVLSDEGQTTFNSREGANKPLLIINSRP